MGAGVDMSTEDIAFKCNFAYINDENEIVERRRVARDFEWGIELCDALNNLKIPGYDEYIVKCEYATEHRCGLKVTGKGLSSLITGSDPLKDNKKILKCKPLDETNQDAVFTANLVNTLSDKIRDTLKNHPINLERKNQGLPFTNLLLLRGCG
jgi:2,3-bisphosphoglycerate-independent phosphoglycerate mutase